MLLSRHVLSLCAARFALIFLCVRALPPSVVSSPQPWHSASDLAAASPPRSCLSSCARTRGRITLGLTLKLRLTQPDSHTWDAM